MNKISNSVLAVIMSCCALALCGGNLLILKAFEPTALTAGIRQLVLGIAVAGVICFSGHDWLRKIAPILTGILLAGLFLCPVFGYRLNGATRWFKISGIDFYFSPALLAMPVLCLLWALVLKKFPEGLGRKQQFYLLGITLLAAGSIFIEPFISMAGFVVLLGMILFCLSGCGYKKAMICAWLFLGVAAVFTIGPAEYDPLQKQKDFYSCLFAPDYNKQYHVWSLATTLKHAVFYGRHQVPAEPKYHIPNSCTDSALAAVCGEYGYGFLIAALLLMLGVIVCGAVIAKRCKDPAERLLAGGMTAVIGLPALVNTLMMPGVLLPGSVSFPFLALGGTAALGNALALGCILSAAKRNAGEGKGEHLPESSC